MIVMKFGGTSVGSAASIKAVCNIIQGSLSRKPIVVVSALNKMTNALLQLASESAQGKGTKTLNSIKEVHYSLLKELDLSQSAIEADISSLEKLFERQLKKKSKKADARTADSFAAFGEQLSSKIVAAYLQKMKISAKAWNAWDIGFVSDSHFGSAEVLDISNERIRKSLKDLNHVAIVTGFIAKDEKGAITTLGRGGSDYTAAIIGAALKAQSIQIWKEVDGLMTTDPKIVENAKVVPELAFEEASELAYFGAKVLHPKTILPAMRADVSVQILNTFNPRGKGTTIISNFERRKKTSQTIDALTVRKGVAALHIYSAEFFEGNKLISDIFELFAKCRINIDVVALSVASVSLVMGYDEQLHQIAKKLKKLGEVTLEKNKAIICAVGGSINAAGVAGRMFTTLGKSSIPVEMISQAASGFSITFVVDEKHAEQAIRVLHKEYIG